MHSDMLFHEQVDVIVSSTDKSLNLTLAATSKSLLRAGGESLQDECIMKYKHGVQPGEVAMTMGGNLHCKQVYHGTIKKWDHNRGDALNVSIQAWVVFMGRRGNIHCNILGPKN